jgi:hypothetical protein
MANKKTIDEFVEDITADVANTKNAEENKHSAKYTRTEIKRKSLVSKYREEPKFAVSISPFYAPYLGKVVRQIVNGIVVDIPADGKTYMVNKTHASHILTKIRRVDAMIARQQRAGDIQNNFEYSPGQLHL